jgi:hypothetical protein
LILLGGQDAANASKRFLEEAKMKTIMLVILLIGTMFPVNGDTGEAEKLLRLGYQPARWDSVRDRAGHFCLIHTRNSVVDQEKLVLVPVMGDLKKYPRWEIMRLSKGYEYANVGLPPHYNVYVNYLSGECDSRIFFPLNEGLVPVPAVACFINILVSIVFVVVVIFAARAVYEDVYG